jgi:riboflavin kinase/FMN adenylyltransferase
MLNLGPRPTFGDAQSVVEAHLFDANLDLYGARVRVDFIARLRDTRKFSGIEALVVQLQKDGAEARRILSPTST